VKLPVSIYRPGASAHRDVPTSLYRYYDKYNVLLYVGITSRGLKRNREHSEFEPVESGAPEDQLAGVWLELDHVQPYSMGGDDTFENLRAACSTCNRRRGVDDLDLWADRIAQDPEALS